MPETDVLFNIKGVKGESYRNARVNSSNELLLDRVVTNQITGVETVTTINAGTIATIQGGLTPAQQTIFNQYGADLDGVEVALSLIATETEERLQDAALGDVAFIKSTDEPEVTTVDGKDLIWLRLNPEYTQVTPTAPTFVDAGPGVSARLTVPAVTGVTYQRNGATIAAGNHTIAPPTTTTIRAVAQLGYSIKGTRQWVHTYEPDATAGFDLYDTFNAADGTPVVGRTLTKGGLVWVSTSNASLAGAELAPTITGNAIVNTFAATQSLTTAVNMPQANCEIWVDYDLVAPVGFSAGRRAYIFVRGISSSDTLTVCVESDGRLFIYKGGGVEIIPAGTRTGHPQAGTLSVRYVDGALTIKINAVTVATATAAQTIGTGFTGTGTKAGYAARVQHAKVDNFRAVYL